MLPNLPPKPEWAKRRSHLLLVLLLLIYVTLTTIYSWSTPIYEAPDEPMHYAYIRHLVEEQSLPPLVGYEGGHPAHQETSQPPLYYTVAALLTFWTPDGGDYADLLTRNPYFAYPAPLTVADNKNTWLHTSAEDLPWRGTVLSIRLTRLVSTLFGILGVIATWGAARQLWEQQQGGGPWWLPHAAAATAAYVPQFIFMSGVISNDIAAMALAAAVLWALLRISHTLGEPLRANWQQTATLGVLVGLAALVKVSMLALIPLVTVAVLLSGWIKRLPWHTPGRSLLIILGLAGVVGGWWYARNWLLYGQLFNTQVHMSSPWAWDGPRPVIEALGQMIGVERSFWGVFGTGNIGLPDTIYDLLRVGSGLGLAGWGLILYTWLREGRAQPAAWMAWTILWGQLVLILALQVRWMQLVLAPWGRLLFPALPAIACLLVKGWQGWSLVLNRVWHTALLPAILLITAALAPWIALRPAFALPTERNTSIAEAQIEKINARLGTLTNLLGYRLEQVSVEPGASLSVATCWHVLETTETDYVLFLQLIDADGGLAASRHTYPGLGRFQTSRWRLGDRFCDKTRLRIPENIIAPAVYRVEVGLLDQASGQRLRTYVEGEHLEGPLYVGQVRIAAPAQVTTQIPPTPLSYTLGTDEIRLIGRTRLPASIETGTTLSVGLYWETEQRPAADYIAFLHLVDSRGTVVAQADHAPRRGWYPTSFWQPGEVISSTYELWIPPSADPGTYRLLGGMYRWPEIVRLPMREADGTRAASDIAEVARIHVRPPE